MLNALHRRNWIQYEKVVSERLHGADMPFPSAVTSEGIQSWFTSSIRPALEAMGIVVSADAAHELKWNGDIDDRSVQIEFDVILEGDAEPMTMNFCDGGFDFATIGVVDDDEEDDEP
jgi:hypothetical protein